MTIIAQVAPNNDTSSWSTLTFTVAERDITVKYFKSGQNSLTTQTMQAGGTYTITPVKTSPILVQLGRVLCAVIYQNITGICYKTSFWQNGGYWSSGQLIALGDSIQEPTMLVNVNYDGTTEPI